MSTLCRRKVEMARLKIQVCSVGFEIARKRRRAHADDSRDVVRRETRGRRAVDGRASAVPARGAARRVRDAKDRARSDGSGRGLSHVQRAGERGTEGAGRCALAGIVRSDPSEGTGGKVIFSEANGSKLTDSNYWRNFFFFCSACSSCYRDFPDLPCAFTRIASHSWAPSCRRAAT